MIGGISFCFQESDLDNGGLNTLQCTQMNKAFLTLQVVEPLPGEQRDTPWFWAWWDRWDKRWMYGMLWQVYGRPDAVWAAGELAVAIFEEDTLPVLLLALLKVGEGCTTRGGVAELLALVRARDALIDQDDVPGCLLAHPLPEHSAGDHCGPARLTSWPLRRPQMNVILALETLLEYFFLAASAEREIKIKTRTKDSLILFLRVSTREMWARSSHVPQVWESELNWDSAELWQSELRVTNHFWRHTHRNFSFNQFRHYLKSQYLYYST